MLEIVFLYRVRDGEQIQRGPTEMRGEDDCECDVLIVLSFPVVGGSGWPLKVRPPFEGRYLCKAEDSHIRNGRRLR